MSTSPGESPRLARKPRILLVDDEPSLVRLISKRLETANYEVIIAMDGLDGLSKARELQPDLIILDLMLPRLNGYDMCTMLKRDPRYEQIPIIMLTARSQETDRQEGLQCGADVYLVKPYDHEVLLKEIQALLAKRPPAA